MASFDLIDKSGDSKVIVDEIVPITLMGAGQATAETVNHSLRHAPILVAADGAADLALELGHNPAAVIGDMDSVSDRTRRLIPPQNFHELSEQDSTDFDKCLRSIRAPLVIGVGFSGGRLDHELAAYAGLLKPGNSPCLLLGSVDLCFHAPRRLALDLPEGTRVSLMPLLPVTGRSTGLRWPIDGLDLRPDGRIGTSNQATGPVRIELDGPGMLAILPVTALEAAIAALRR